MPGSIAHETSDSRDGERPPLRRLADRPVDEGEALVAQLGDRLSAPSREARATAERDEGTDERFALLTNTASNIAQQPEAPLEVMAQQAVPLLGDWARFEAITAASTEPAHCAVVNANTQAVRGNVEEYRLSIPVVARGTSVGALTLGRACAEGEFSEDDICLAEQFAVLLGLAAEQQRLMKASETAARTKAEFLTMMSHELRTPLNAIAGYAQLLEMGFRGPLNEEQLEAVSRILRGQEHLLSLVDGVLTYSRLTNGTLILASENSSARQLIDVVTTPLQEEFDAAGVSLVISPCPPDTYVCVDTRRAAEVLRHLVENALKFTLRGGEVRVMCEAAGRQVQFVVEDTGRGIPADQIEAVFHPFVQVEKAHTRTVDGSGLGLAIGRELAERMGGSLTVTSEEGKGSRFVLLLSRATPLRDAAKIDTLSAPG